MHWIKEREREAGLGESRRDVFYCYHSDAILVYCQRTWAVPIRLDLRHSTGIQITMHSVSHGRCGPQPKHYVQSTMSEWVASENSRQFERVVFVLWPIQTLLGKQKCEMEKQLVSCMFVRTTSRACIQYHATNIHLQYPS